MINHISLRQYVPYNVYFKCILSNLRRIMPINDLFNDIIDSTIYGIYVR